MKKSYILISIILTFTTLTACTSKPKHSDANTYVAGQDFAYMDFRSGGQVQQTVSESPDGYYFHIGDFVYYADKSTMTPVILCNRPNCLHDGETEADRLAACNAYFYASPYALTQYYEGALYAFIVVPRSVYTEDDKLQLLKVSPDGVKREVLLEVSGIKDPPRFMAIHRGKIYYNSDTYTQDGIHVSGIKEISLDKPSDEPRVIYSADAKADTGQQLFPYGNNLYFGESTYDKSYLMRYDILTGKTACIDDFHARMSENEPAVALALWQSFGTVYKDKLYYNNISQTADASREETVEYWLSDLDGGHAVEITDPNLQIAGLASDGKYIFSDKIEALPDYSVVSHEIHATDETGKAYASFDVGDMGGRLIAGGEAHAFYINETYGPESMTQIYYADKSQIENGVFEFTLLLQKSSKK